MLDIQLVEENENVDDDFAELIELFFDLVEELSELLAFELLPILFHEELTRLFDIFFLLVNELFDRVSENENDLSYWMVVVLEVGVEGQDFPLEHLTHLEKL
mmetsp:Transcript_41401/g.39853  ORF Transcript_41401/g.39853 Transcript_41401/m.39853 type:complete len:102 (-) Transcript_41401:823-1128(-)